jgi:hypothetical protein
MTPEAKARQNIDALLVASGWHVCNVADDVQGDIDENIRSTSKRSQR